MELVFRFESGSGTNAPQRLLAEFIVNHRQQEVATEASVECDSHTKGKVVGWQELYNIQLEYFLRGWRWFSISSCPHIRGYLDNSP